MAKLDTVRTLRNEVVEHQDQEFLAFQRAQQGRAQLYVPLILRRLPSRSICVLPICSLPSDSHEKLRWMSSSLASE